MTKRPEQVQGEERQMEVDVDYRKELQRKEPQEKQGETRIGKDPQSPAMKETSFPEMFFG